MGSKSAREMKMRGKRRCAGGEDVREMNMRGNKRVGGKEQAEGEREDGSTDEGLTAIANASERREGARSEWAT
eukprot:1641482-Pleurochrysis_carterae.AAC.1